MSTSQALFAPAQAKVLGRLFGDPGRWFHLNELIRVTGLGSASTQREVKRLVDADLIETERVGNVRRLRANPASPIYSELVAIVAKTLGPAQILRAALTPLVKQISLALLYGAVAKGDDPAANSIDLLIVSDQIGVAELLPYLLPVEAQLGRSIAPLSYTRVAFDKQLRDIESFVNRILAQRIEVVLGDADEFSFTKASAAETRSIKGNQ